MKSNFCKRVCLILETVICFSLLAISARAATMPVVNSGFETGDLTGWSTLASTGYGTGTGVVNNVTDQSATYPDFSNPLPGTASGTYFGWIAGYEGHAAEVLYQDVSANGQGNPTLQPNTTYTLTVAIGVGRYSTLNNGYIALVNGTGPTGTVLATAQVSTLGFSEYANNFKDLTVTFTTGPTVSGDLTIEIATAHGYPSTGDMFYDNVRLTSVAAGPYPVAVANQGFETGTMSGWSIVSTSGYGAGASVIDDVTDQSNTYPRFANPLPGTAAGTYYCSITGYDGNPAEIVYQDVSANGLGNGPLQPNTTYSLLVSVGIGRYSAVVNNAYISLINGTNSSGTVLATTTVSTLGMGPYMGKFRDLLLTFTTGPSVSGDLTIAIGTTHGYPSTGFIAVDNVRLTAAPLTGAETIGGGTIATPAVGPQPTYGIDGTGFTLVKNWHFGTNGTIKNNTDLDANFQFHDQFGTYHNPNVAAKIVAPDSADALSGQPYEGQVISGVPVPTTRTFFSDYMQTYLVPLGGVTTVTPASYNCGSGSFQAKFTLPNGGSLLGHDMIWETRVRYVTPPYFYFAIWDSGNIWNKGAEMDLIESFGYDNTPTGGNTNFQGLYWHSNTVSGTDQVTYNSWTDGMGASGFATYDPTQYHIWTMVYNKDNTYALYVDGTKVQYGSGPYWWTVGASSTGTPINLSFIFDGSWGSNTIASMDHPLATSSLSGCYYEWNYSRVYLR